MLFFCMIAFNDAILQANNSVGIIGNIFFMRHQDNCVSIGLDFIKNIHDFP